MIAKATGGRYCWEEAKETPEGIGKLPLGRVAK